jgi:hypothetical protein
VQENLLSKKVSETQISLADYKSNIHKNNNFEFILYADNILEGIYLLNLISENEDLLKFHAVVYEPIDQPIYIFKVKNNFLSIKICGNFNNWELPDEVNKLISFIDLPDYLIYSVKKKKIILAGETTETVSVGNSQWQREGRKVGAAKINIPFIYQTFYSGRDESQNKIREPSSLQAYNHLLYSVKYKTPSFVIYLENNHQNSKTRKRKEESIINKYILYIKTLLLNSIDQKYHQNKINIEQDLFQHMLSFLLEKKYYETKKNSAENRLIAELPSIDKNLYKNIKNNPKIFVEQLTNYINTDHAESNFKNDNNFSNIDIKYFGWKNNSLYIQEFVEELKKDEFNLSSATNRSRIGFCNSKACEKILKKKFSNKKDEIEKIFFGSENCILFPLRLHKGTNSLVFSPDPESGEIVAFSELFSTDINNKKIRPIIGYCTVKTPKNFELESKKGTKLYKAISNYIDCVVINGDTLITNFNKVSNEKNNFFPKEIISLKKNNNTEEIAIISTFLQLGSIKSDWDLCFIHTHHSSWQQLILYKNNIISQKLKINRNQDKIDLVMQKNDIYLIGEGKKEYRNFFSTKEEIYKISSSIKNISSQIKKNYLNTYEIYSFICIVNIPEVNSNFFLNSTVDEIEKSIKNDHLEKIVSKDYLVIIVYEINKKTLFKLIFSEIFKSNIKENIINIFSEKIN